VGQGAATSIPALEVDRSARPIRTHVEVAVAACHAIARHARSRHPSSLVAVALVALALAGCQLRVATDIVVEVDGSGTASMRIVVDEELAETLAEAEVDLQQGLDDAAAGADWEARPLEGADGTGVELRTSFATPEELGERVAELSAALTEDDGALLRDVELRRTEDGGYAFSASAGIDPPRIVGSLPLDEGSEGAVRFDGDDLAAALEEGGEELARADLRVTFPTVPVAEGATVETTAATWNLPNHELATVSATAPPLPVDRTFVLLAAAGVGAALLAAFAVRLVRRRR